MTKLTRIEKFNLLHEAVAALPGITRRRYHEVDFQVEQPPELQEELFYYTDIVTHSAVQGDLKITTIALRRPCGFVNDVSITANDLRVRRILNCEAIRAAHIGDGGITLAPTATKRMYTLVASELKAFKTHRSYFRQLKLYSGLHEYYTNRQSMGNTAGMCIRIETPARAQQRLVYGFILVETIAA